MKKQIRYFLIQKLEQVFGQDKDGNIILKSYQKIGLLFFSLGVIMMVITVLRFLLGNTITPFYFFGTGLPTLIVGISIISKPKIGAYIQIWLLITIGILYITVYGENSAGGLLYGTGLFLICKYKIGFKKWILLITTGMYVGLVLIVYILTKNMDMAINNLYNIFLLAFVSIIYLDCDCSLL